MVRELQELAPQAASSRKLATLVARFVEVERGLDPAQRGVVERIYLNRLLWQAAPVRIAETWAIEHTVDTETLPLTPP